jgi:SPP1 family predicted phage head-tail adaptor
MKIGKLNKRIVITQTVTTPDGAGGFEKTSETTIGTFWASVKEKRTGTGIEAGHITLTDVYEIAIRTPNFDLNREYSVTYNGLKLGIESVITETFYTKIICKKNG